MNTENTEFSGSETSLPKKKKKKKLLILLVVLVLILAAGGGFAYYYFSERAHAQDTVEEFLSGVQKMDFSLMENHLQSKDLSALDQVDLRNAVYMDFFQEINQQMSFKISKNNFDLKNKTAKITVHIKYVDGSDIYQAAVSEFLRQMVSTAFSEESMTSDEAHEKLASIMQEKAAATEYTFAETDVTYPVIKTGKEWKVASLDQETVKIMSANFQSVAKELENSLSGANTDGDGTADVPSPSNTDTIDMQTDKFTIHYTQHRVSKDFAGKPCLLVYYDYTNNGTVSSSAMVDVSLQAYQNGKACDASIPETNDTAVDNFMKEIEPGKTVNVCQVFSLSDESDVTLKASETFSFSDGQTASQILKIK